MDPSKVRKGKPEYLRKVKNRTHNQSKLIQAINLLKFLEDKVHHHVYLDMAGDTHESHRLDYANQQNLHIWLEKIRGILEEVLEISRTSKRYRRDI